MRGTGDAKGSVMPDLVSMLAESVGRHASRPLFGTRARDGKWTWTTYEQFSAQVDALRGALSLLGVEPGERIAVVSRNRVEWAVGCYAAVGLGAAYVPMYEVQSERDWRHILADSGARVCLFSGATVGDRVASVAGSLDTLRHLVNFDADGEDPRGYHALLTLGGQHPTPALRPRPQDVAEIVYTSGTTGTPKGVRLTHSNIVSNVEAVIEVVPFSADDRSLSFLPWAHVFGGDELHGIVRLGASMAISESVDRIARDLSEVRPTVLFAVPRVWNEIHRAVRDALAKRSTAVRRVVERGTEAMHRRRLGAKLSWADALALAAVRRMVFSRVRERFGGRLRLAVSGAAALAPEVAEFLEDLGVVVLEAYGLTETSCCATINRPDDRRIGSVGKPIPGVRVELDRSVQGAEGGAGEIVVRGHCVMAGYHNLPEQTARTITADQGVRTGDLGRIDADGFLYVTGRLKELYKLENGKYVAPAPLEEHLALSPYVEQALVHGANEPYNVALVVPRRTALIGWAQSRGLRVEPLRDLLESGDVQDLIRRELDRLGIDFKGYERIRAFKLLDEPFSTDNGLLTPTLKIKRARVEERYRGDIAALYASPARPSPAPSTCLGESRSASSPSA